MKRGCSQRASSSSIWNFLSSSSPESEMERCRISTCCRYRGLVSLIDWNISVFWGVTLSTPPPVSGEGAAGHWWLQTQLCHGRLGLPHQTLVHWARRRCGITASESRTESSADLFQWAVCFLLQSRAIRSLWQVSITHYRRRSHEAVSWRGDARLTPMVLPSFLRLLTICKVLLLWSRICGCWLDDRWRGMCVTVLCIVLFI